MGGLHHSLRVRLLVTFLLVVGIALGIVAIYASRVTASEFERSLSGILRYRDPRLESKINLILKTITHHDGERPIWEELGDLLVQMQFSSHIRFVLADLDGRVYADSESTLVGQMLNIDQSKPFAAFLIEGKPFLAYFEPLDVPNLQLISTQFTHSVNRAMLLAILVAGLFTLTLTLLLSRSILGPISALTRAAQQMGRGDLSQRVHVRARGEVGDLASAFNSMADSLERIEQLRRNMVSDVAHELRTPLANIQGYLEALQDGIVKPTPKMIASLHEEALALNHLVDDLQELALAEAGQLHMRLQPVDLAEVAEKAVIALEPQARAKDLQFEMAIPTGLPQAQADPERLGQVLRNLLNNAVSYTPTGGKISISAMPLGDTLTVSVKDSGEGIAPEHLPNLFERFYRVEKSRSRATGGAGLGLTIVKQLVEAQGGSVEVESTLGRGTTFTFTLPIAAPAPYGFAPRARPEGLNPA